MSDKLYEIARARIESGKLALSCEDGSDLICITPERLAALERVAEASAVTAALEEHGCCCSCVLYPLLVLGFGAWLAWWLT